MSLWQKARSTLTHPLIAGLVGGLLVVFLSYLDSKIRKIERENDTYWKLGVVSSLIISSLVYVITEEFVKNDEFLNQKFETELSSSMMPKKGGYMTEAYQPELKGPSDVIEKMGSLEPISSERPSMPKPVFGEVTMDVKKHRSHRKHRRH